METQSMHGIEPVQMVGGLRRLKAGNPMSQRVSPTQLSLGQFAAGLQQEIDRALADERTVLVLRVLHRPVPGYEGDLRKVVPVEIRDRIGSISELIRLSAISSSEFLVSIGSLRRRSDGEEFVGLVLQALRPPIVVDGLPHHLDPRVGAALLDRENPSVELLLDGAALALSESDDRHHGMMFHPYQRVRRQRQSAMEHDLRAAVLANEAGSAVQPAYDLATGELRAFEVFARWNRAGKGHVPAAEFVQVAEEIGVSHILGRQVLQRALFVASDLVDGGHLSDITLWANVAPGEVMHPEFFNTITAAISINPRVRVGLELSPSPPADANEIHEVLKQLVARGARAAVGDFGIGNANLTVLRQLPFDSVKIDRSLTRQIVGSEQSADVVKMLIELAALLDFEVTAQGIETEAQAELLRSLGCAIGQGYHFGVPVDIAEIGTILRPSGSSS